MYQEFNEHSDELIYIISIKLNNDDAQRATYGTPSLATRNQVVMEFLEKNPGIELTTFSLCKNCFEKQFAKPTTGYYH